MKLSDALEWIRKHNENVGMVRVSFEWRRDGVLESDFFPARNEPPLSPDEATIHMHEFARAMKGKVVNVYLVDAKDFTPLGDYNTRVRLNPLCHDTP